MTETKPDAKPMKLRYAGTCRECGTDVDAGQRGVYFRSAKAIECIPCYEGRAEPIATALAPAPTVMTAPPEVVVDPAPSPPVYSEGVAGGSAREEYERRMARREQRVKERFPRAGGVLLKVFEERQSTKAWKIGAGGEELIGGMLDRMAGPTLRVLHDRRIPRSRANIDHIVVCPNGVMVIDAKKYKGKVALKVEGGILRPVEKKLMVAGRDRTKLVDGVVKQVGLVTDVLADVPVPVQGFLCFLGVDWPLIGGAFEIDDVGVMWPRRLRKILEADGPLTVEEIDDLQARVATALPAA